MLWLSITIISYLLFAVVFLVDKYLLTGPIGNPKVLTFYIGLMGALGILAVPFGIISPAPAVAIVTALATGAIRIWATYYYFRALQTSEASRIITAVNAVQPVISVCLAWIISRGAAVLEIKELAAFALILAGSVVIMAEKNIFSRSTLRFSAISAFLFSLSFIGAKRVYEYFAALSLAPAILNLDKGFASGFLWMGFGSLLAALAFLLSPSARQVIFAKKREAGAGKIAGVFLANQSAGAMAFILQNYAVNLAPLAFVAVINALAGVQYIFLFVFTVIISTYFPKILKEKTTLPIVIQKLAAIALIIAGLAIFSLN